MALVIRRCHHRDVECYCVRGDDLLYAVPHQFFNPKTRRWEADITYVHARDAGEAYWMFIQCEWQDKPRMANIVVAPAIGFFVDDNRGQQLSV